MSSSQKIVISGGPGSGKTSLIDFLTAAGYSTFEEVSRVVIQEGRSLGKANYFLEDPYAFSEILFEGRKKQYEKAQKMTPNGTLPYVFFDRGIHDTYAYLEAMGLATAAWKKKMEAYRYDFIFLLPPWKAIYQTDEERKEDFPQAQLFYKHIKKVYETAANTLIEVPIGSVAERTAFILKQLGDHG